MGKLNIFKYLTSGEDDGRRICQDGYCLCNRCRTVMQPEEDMDEMVSYYICPKCKFIEIQEYYEDDEDEDYELYWSSDDYDAYGLYQSSDIYGDCFNSEEESDE